METKSLRILVVDDDEDDFIVVRDLLRSTAEIDYVPTVPAALERIHSGSHDLLLLDYRLGAETGLDLLKEVRRRGVDAPVILLTGRGDEEVAVEALKSGACDYLLKSKLTESALSRAVTYAIKIHRDAKLLDAAQAKLRESEQKFRSLVENICDTILILDSEGIVRYANSSQQTLGYAFDENLGRSGFEFVHPDDRARVRQAFIACASSPGAIAHAELRGRHKDGSWRDIEATAVNHLDLATIQGLVVSYHDVTERKRAQADLQRIAWMLTGESSRDCRPESPQSYGELTELNTNRLILDSVGIENLRDIAADFLDLLGTSAAIYERNGDYAFGMFSSGWCRLLDSASRRLCKTSDGREALACGRWLCHESCWNKASRLAIEMGQPVDVECDGAIRLYAVPVRSGTEIIGAVNFGYGDPPRETTTLQELAQKYEIGIEELRTASEDYESRPLFIVETAKRRLQVAARQIGEIVRRKQAERGLRMSDEIVRHAGALILLCDGDGAISYASESITNVLGYRAEDVLGDGWWRLAFEDPAESQVMRQKIASVARGETLPESAPYMRRIRRQDGTYRYILWHDTRTPERQVIGIGQDITALKETESALQNANEQLSMLLNSLPVVVYRADPKTLRTTYISAQIRQMTGFSSEEFQRGSFWIEHVHPDDLPVVTEAIRNLTANGACAFEYRFRSADGTYHWVLDSSRLVCPADSAPEYVAGTWLQIDDHKLAEETLRLQSTALQAAANAIVITDTDGRVIWINPAYAQITGYSAEEVVGSTAQIFEPPQSSSDNRHQLKQAVMAGEVWHGEMPFRRKDGTQVWADVMVTPVKEHDGRISNFVAVKQDITEQRRLREQLAQAQKMEAIGRLSGGVAHDFNNILGVILGYSELLAERIPASDPLHKQVEQIHRAGERAADLTRQLLAFSRQQVLQPVVLNLNSVLGEMDKMLHRLIGEDVEINITFSPELANITADRSQIEQIIMNLAVNARDAMPRGGRLSIETANCLLDESYARDHANLQPGPYVMLAVSDTGVGMPKDVQARIFEPFFTTKDLGKGTGLGLATVYGIVKQSGGYIWVYSEVGQGTCFKIYLPSALESAAKLKPPGEVPVSVGQETVLLVEDSEQLRTLTGNLLKNSGYRVLEAADPNCALAVSSSHKGKIDLLVTDVVLPQMNGQQLAQRLTSQRPEMKVLYVSGYTNEAIVARGFLGEGSAFLQKPFSGETLRRKVREVLNAAVAFAVCDEQRS